MKSSAVVDVYDYIYEPEIGIKKVRKVCHVVKTWNRFPSLLFVTDVVKFSFVDGISLLNLTEL